MPDSHASDPDYIVAHRHSIRHRQEIESSDECGCFFCLARFDHHAIEEWVDDGEFTALCPHCGIDSVIGSASGFAITDELLVRMKLHWFADV